MQNTREQTFGEKAVGLIFNPSNDPLVQSFKQKAADFIDECHALRLRTDDPEIKRMASLAITEAQAAQMWAEKAATWGSHAQSSQPSAAQYGAHDAPALTPPA